VIWNHARNEPVTTTDRLSAIQIISHRDNRWQAVCALVGVKWTNRTRKSPNEIIAIRKRAVEIIEDKTGYAKLATTEEYADALRAASGDGALEDALYALLAEHARLIGLNVIAEPRRT
jgi:hypothetical protein